MHLYVLEAYRMPPDGGVLDLRLQLHPQADFL
jgi:hypothetical protein